MGEQGRERTNKKNKGKRGPRRRPRERDRLNKGDQGRERTNMWFLCFFLALLLPTSEVAGERYLILSKVLT